MLKSILLACLAVVGLVNAQSDDDDACDAESTTVRTQEDLDALRSCTTLSGDLILGPNLVLATINGIRSIRGDLICAKSDIQQLSAPELATIGGTFNLTSLTALRSLNFPFLRSVGTIYWQSLTGLSNLDFNSQVTRADRVTITDTILESLQGINLVTVQRFDINNNRYLKEVKVQLTNITDSLAIEFNSPSVVASFPNLTWANNATFRSCGSVQLPALTTVNGSLGFFENSFESFEAPKLTIVGTGAEGGDITFANNDELKNVSMPELKTIIGTLQFVNDSAIEEISGFPKLSVVHGSIDISGKFDQVDFPALKDVRGGFNLQTTAQFDCTNFDKLDGSVVKGKFVCSGAVTNPGTEGTDPETNGGGSNGGGSGNKNAAGRLSTTNSFAAIPALALFAALFL